MIRRLELSDPDMVEQIWHLQHAAYRLEAAAIGLRHTPELPDTFESIAASTDLFFGWITDENEVRAAITIGQDDPKVIAIHRLMIHPEHLRQGFGKAMVRYIIQAYPNANCFVVYAGVRNAPAIRLYESLGFVAKETYKAALGIELIRMSRQNE
ncbi:ribosomal protein S18 acetylase RimI-like enzyme [Paenibacillus shirakamiensis]|uniref:Ribosomal protein S18 acetylase RimI-like enzyme n=1 Tax=Paenibacillus shirakamiensis TaxID=1265935 RepID=A0ABS4JL94_9BACL|nr:GNAT family N-acetyltransferase [Paenibacillus shirakamiensis]MBP2002487.1 ribosomal protein S18 acetylase RimI-like enzyme [Paenibacillus shirakamiensis]